MATQSNKTRLETGSLYIRGSGIFHSGSEIDGVNMSWDGTNTLNLDALTANDTIRIGESVLTDFQVDGATDLLWDASAGSLANGGFIAGFYANAAIQNVTDAGGAINVTSSFTTINADADGSAFTLADGTAIGFLKTITIITLADADPGAEITPVTFLDGTTITMTVTGDSITLIWTATGWRTVEKNSATVVIA